MTLGIEYLKVVRERFNSLKVLGDKTIQQLSNDDIHWAINESVNNVAVIVKHVSGNMISRWTDFLISDGEKPDRNRDQEFIDTLSTKHELLIAWEKGWATLFNTLSNLNAKDLLTTIYIRGEGHTVLEAIERQLAHYAYHIGQLVFIGKQVKGDSWESLSIPTGQSEDYLQQMPKSNHSNN